MELRQLQYVLKVAEERSFSRAAEKLHIAQPSLSQQILKLEQQLGVKLFDRTSTPLDLTFAGERFVATAGRILDLTDQLRREMEDVANLKKGRLVIGSLPITGAHVLPLVLPVFQKKFPGIEAVLVEDTTEELETLTVKGKTDITLLTLPLGEPSLVYEPILKEEILLAVPPGHPLAKKTARKSGMKGKPVRVNLASLRREPFILLKQGQGFRQIVLDLCREAGFEPQIAFESSNIETVQSLVAAGMGITLVPEMVARSGWTSIRPIYMQLAEPVPTRTLVVAYREGRYLSKAALSFVEMLKEIMVTKKERHGSGDDRNG
ncbi:LysR family transcriptional regulator [Effusibacillus lacus]|uniref:Transcriptional regulator n=1 Tax=Effusibacillus lacus TaxID=1348429 RepID=A0A292YCB6_9BACL|nr:LysR family transcriptional regulator [Effusibacillus lacus]TCS75477.1 DNA-binding transcriptional LysR family regulator [Effusibacillus lacus]GAX88942.1 transcriptional regulator [Effusibacillus lacus]